MWLVLCIVAILQITALGVKLTGKELAKMDELKRKYNLQIPLDEEQAQQRIDEVEKWHVSLLDREKKADKIFLLQILEKMKAGFMDAKVLLSAQIHVFVEKMDWKYVMDKLVGDLKKFNKNIPDTPEVAGEYIATMPIWYTENIQGVKSDKELMKALLERLQTKMLEDRKRQRVKDLIDRFLSHELPKTKLTDDERIQLNKLILKAGDTVHNSQWGWVDYMIYLQVRTDYPPEMTDEDILSLIRLSIRRTLDYSHLSTSSESSMTRAPYGVASAQKTPQSEEVKSNKGASLVATSSIKESGEEALPTPKLTRTKSATVRSAMNSTKSSLQHAAPARVIRKEDQQTPAKYFHKEFERTSSGFSDPVLKPQASAIAIRTPISHSTQPVVKQSVVSQTLQRLRPRESNEADTFSLMYTPKTYEKILPVYFGPPD